MAAERHHVMWNVPDASVPRMKLVERPRRELKIELIPRQMSGMNARAVLTREAWDQVRDITHALHGGRCAECGSDSRVECHEEWQYEWAHRDRKNLPVMRLAALRTLCRLCHLGKHIRFAENHCPGELPYVRRHLMRLYALSEAQLDDHVRKALEIVRKLTFNYRLDLTYLNDERFAAVHVLMGRTFGNNENKHCKKPCKHEAAA
jgi:hypothetical protein